MAAPGQAEASVIYVPVNVTLSTQSGPSTWETGQLGFAPLENLRFTVRTSSNSVYARAIPLGISPNLWLQACGCGQLELVPFGYSPYLSGPYLSGATNQPLFVVRIPRTAPGGNFPTFGTSYTPSNRFAFFSFKDTVSSNNRYDFGWVQLGFTLTATDMQLTIVDYAIQTDGTPLFAGDTVGTPEPGTLGSTAIGALLLGAVGLRRWRASRKAA